ncbi:MAG: hypothetical protein ACT4P2_12910 [Pseudomonadota bacterium]
MSHPPARDRLRILGEADVRRLIGPGEALAVVEEVFRRYGTGEARLSSASSLSLAARPTRDLAFKVKGATVDHLGRSGFRLLARVLSKPDWTSCNYTYVVANDTGRLVGLVDEVWLAGLRTAATAVVACRMLARPGAKRWALIGSGRIARELCGLLARVAGIAHLAVWSRQRKNAAAMVTERCAGLPFPVRIADSPQAAIEGADVAITLTDAPTPFVRLDWLGPGSTLCVMGGDSELLPDGFTAIDRLIVDDPDFAFTLGSLAAWVRHNAYRREDILARIDATIGEVAAGAKPGRQDERERVLAVIQGMAICDLALAAAALAAAERQGIGTVADLP